MTCNARSAPVLEDWGKEALCPWLRFLFMQSVHLQMNLCETVFYWSIKEIISPEHIFDRQVERIKGKMVNLRLCLKIPLDFAFRNRILWWTISGTGRIERSQLAQLSLSLSKAQLALSLALNCLSSLSLSTVAALSLSLSLPLSFSQLSQLSLSLSLCYLNESTNTYNSARQTRTQKQRPESPMVTPRELIQGT